MGWSSCNSWKTKKDVVDELKRDLSRNYHIIDDKSTTSGYWAVIERITDKDRYIIFSLIRKEGGYYSTKEMSESMHPMYYDCPLSFLDLVPPAYLHWRNKVKSFHEKKHSKKVLVPDSVVTLYNKKFKVVRPEKRGYIVTCVDTGARYKLRSSQIGDCIV